MSVALQRGLVAFGTGCVFAVGLLLSGMTDPKNVLGFLDVFGDWNPRLMFVMGGAIAVHMPLQFWIRRRAKPLLGPRFVIPTRRTIDAALVGGAALFGIGWGISGYCPGPSLVSLPAADPGVLVFVLGVVIGTWLPHALTALRAASPPASEPT